MLSYPLSVIAFIVFILVGIFWLFRRNFPGLYSFLFRSGRLVWRNFRVLLDRLGWLRLLFLFYIVFALIFSVVVFVSINVQNWLAGVGKLTIVWVVAVIGRWILRWVRRWQERRYILSGRDRR